MKKRQFVQHFNPSNIHPLIVEEYEKQKQVDNDESLKSTLKLTIVGDGWDILKAQIQHEAEHNNFDASDIVFTGRVSNSEMMALLARHVLFISPIIGSTGINTKNLLALEAGIPLITTSLGAEGIVFDDMNYEINNEGNHYNTKNAVIPFLVADEPSLMISSILCLYADYYKSVMKITSASNNSFLTDVESMSMLELDTMSYGNRTTLCSNYSWQKMAEESPVYIYHHFNQLQQIKDLIRGGM